MEKIEHKYLEFNGVKHHYAEAGGDSWPPVVFLHGFPEIWYSWRYQMIAVAEAGFRAIALDFRGYGLSDPSPDPRKTTFSDLVGDLYSLLDVLNITEFFLIGKDFGVFPLSLCAISYTERLLGFVTLGVPPLMLPRPVTRNPPPPEGFYISRWKEPGRAEADFGRLDPKTVVRNLYTMFAKSEIPIARQNQEIMDLVEPSAPLPSWFTEEDLATYAAHYEYSGFRTALQLPYRLMDETKDLYVSSHPYALRTKIGVPGLLIMGEKDFVLKFPGMEEFIRNGTAKSYVPKLEIVFMPEGSHFVQEQSPDEVNSLILNFLKTHTPEPGPRRKHNEVNQLALDSHKPQTWLTGSSSKKLQMRLTCSSSTSSEAI